MKENKNLTREQQIDVAAYAWGAAHAKFEIYQSDPGFVAGAEWADEHPDEKKFQQDVLKYLLDRGWPVDLNGSIPTFDDIMHDVGRYLIHISSKKSEKKENEKS